MFSPSATQSATKKMADMMHAAPSSLDYRYGSHERLEERSASNWRAMVHGEPHVVAWNYRSDGCLVLSFDGGWYPFLDNTQGYNRGPQRWYVPKMSRLLARVAHAMQTPEQKRFSGGRPGGRVFLHSTGVVRRPTAAP